MFFDSSDVDVQRSFSFGPDEEDPTVVSRTVAEEKARKVSQGSLLQNSISAGKPFG
jgi:hypothetical protein